MFNIAAWNIRGFNAASKKMAVKRMISKYKISYFFVIETRIFNNNSSSIIQGFNSDRKHVTNHDYAPNGRICCLWDSSIVYMQILWATDQIMMGTLKHKATNVTLTFWATYESNEHYERMHMWNDLISFAANVQGPWVATGDFNTILSN